MFRRWFIRIFLLGLFLLSLAGWLAGCTNKPSITYASAHQFFWIEPIGSSFFAGWTTDSFEFNPSLEFNFYTDPANEYTESYISTCPHTMGFYAGTQTYRWGSSRIIAAPFWLLTLASALIAIYAWRKTAPAPNPATAFPVELKP